MANLRVEGNSKPGTELNVKRFYVPGFIIKSDCPNCGKEQDQDLGDQYLSYPSLGVPSKVHFACEPCPKGDSSYGDEDPEIPEERYSEWHEAVIVTLAIVPAQLKDS